MTRVVSGPAVGVCSRGMLASLGLAAFGALLFSASRVDAQSAFVRGDADFSGAIGITDPIRILQFAFLGQTPPCQDALDVDNNERVRIDDAVQLIEYLFLSGPPPHAPFPGCGIDDDPDPRPHNWLGCGYYPGEKCRRDCSESTLFGVDVTADVAIFLIDRSGSFRRCFPAVVEAVQESIACLPESSRFAVLAFDHDSLQIPGDVAPALATSQEKSVAIEALDRLRPGSGSCPSGALSRAFELAASVEGDDKRIYYLSDGGTHCPIRSPFDEAALALSRATDLDNAQIAITAIGLRQPGDRLYEELLRDLASTTGGEFVVGDCQP